MPKHSRPSLPGENPRNAKIPEHAVPGDPVERRWQQVQQELRYYWECLTEADLLQIAGERDALLRVLHEKYGYSRDRADHELKAVLSGKHRKKG